MHDLTPITALGGKTPRIDTVKRVTCTEVPGVALASVAGRLRTDPPSEILAETLGMEMPGPGRFETDGLTAFWTGPDQWMIEAPHGTHEELSADLKSRLGDRVSVVEQTDAWAKFDLTGDDLLPVLELLSNLDTRRMGPGSAHRTQIHHLGCFLLIRSDRVSLYGPRASAGSLHHAIVTAMVAAL